MIVSLNEIEVTVVNAASGAGAPTGLAEDAGAAAAWLALRGLPVAPVIRLALDGLVSGTSGPPQFGQWRDGRVTSAAPCVSAVLAASPACDVLLAEPCDDWPAVRFDAIDAPLLVAAAAGLASARYGASFVVNWESGGGTVRFVSERESTVAHVPGRPAPWHPEPAALTIERAGAGEFDTGHWPGDVIGADAFARARSHVLAHGVAVDDGDWDRLRSLAARMLVPASERSRAVGAGAGLIDFD